ncbi:glutamate-5-semialdehyde dehydrogenase [Thermoflavimicrobium dichotomicum]|uniref:Gamma-glutamyl phosphate reductase n=1 Tax=Thermoflavimicrobium dichotomicum TaxID=46223 RepID=A0A1I3VEP8_9BACL|nr:glutamate-5-semialdehyde dehydrogenase [Thermoflavimicrobium dichotomicum]SFJ93479.1 glutamate-5-semialdehyde dehydrogenase [Thermoflavimicrobium dichotomicum]
MTDTVTLQAWVLNKAKAAKKASHILATLSTEEKNAALLSMANSLWQHRKSILQANLEDIEQAQKNQLPQARIDRLLLDEKRLQQMIEGLHQIVELADPVGEILESFKRPNGLQIEQVRVPFGAIAMIYESRPNVTVDAAGLALKTGNAIVLRGGKEALRSNDQLVYALQKGLESTAIPLEAIQFIDRTERETVDFLIQAKGIIDLVIPRGGAGLIQHVIQKSIVPVIETGVGNCHLYIDKAADLDKATAITINAKTQRPSVCNAIETLLVHEQLVETWLPQVLTTLTKYGVEIRGCHKTQSVAKEIPLIPATEEDYRAEFLDLTLAVKVVSNVDEAIQHINQYGTQHSEAIITEDEKTAQKFLAQVDAAAVYHNASTRFTDGFEFGFGAEIGISTQKLHARGPMGLKELTSHKYVIRGTGQIRT